MTDEDEAFRARMQLQALNRFLEVHRTPGDPTRLKAFSEWLVECPSHRQAYAELKAVVAFLASGPEAIDIALDKLLQEYTVSTTQH